MHSVLLFFYRSWARNYGPTNVVMSLRGLEIYMATNEEQGCSRFWNFWDWKCPEKNLWTELAEEHSTV